MSALWLVGVCSFVCARRLESGAVVLHVHSVSRAVAFGWPKHVQEIFWGVGTVLAPKKRGCSNLELRCPLVPAVNHAIVLGA